jgi:Peptidase M15
MAGENLLRLRVAASDTIADGDIRYEVRETSEGHVVDTSAISDRDVVIPLTHAPLTGLLSPRHGPRLLYEIVVTAPGGLRATTRVQQGTRSQVRQEYVDKRELRRGFRWSPPARSALIDGAGMPALASPFGFQDFVAHSDYRDNGLAVVAQSAVIAESVARLYAKPLRITSGWRNPRRNDAVEGEEDSYHQTGDAVDLNPSWSKTQWPDATYEASQVTLWRRAQQLNARGHRYDVILHGSGNSRHLHVEPR